MFAPPEFFPVPLEYSAEERRLEYQGAHAGQQIAQLHYMLPQGTDRGYYALMAGIMTRYRIEALIDRMAFVWVTKKPTTWRAVRSVLRDELGESCFVEQWDKARSAPQIAWPGVASNIQKVLDKSGNKLRVFTVMVQAPTPDALHRALSKLAASFPSAMKSGGRIMILEVALDFHPRSSSPEERLTLHEHMVGLLQRHHHMEKLRHGEGAWLAKCGFDTSQSDARQVYVSVGGSSGTRTDRLFGLSSSTPSTAPDTALLDPEVRERLLNPGGSKLFLDSTLYKGTKDGPLLIRIQHKITDEVNPTRGTKRDLPDEERRPRIEVVLKGSGFIREQLGISTMPELGSVRFRNLKTEFFRFWVSKDPKDPGLREAVQEQLASRGVYGCDHYQRALVAKDHLEMPTGSAGGRTSTRVPKQLLSPRANITSWKECSEAVGDALDALSKKWEAFEFQVEEREEKDDAA